MEMAKKDKKGRLDSELNRTGFFQNPRRVCSPRGAPAP